MYLSQQEIFDKVAKHLLTQNQKAEEFVSEKGHMECRYRTLSGLSCAIGCLIKPECYNPSIEGKSVNIIRQIRDRPFECEIFSKVLECSNIPSESNDISLLNALQAIHDRSEVVDWKRHLERVAKDYLLSPMVLHG